MRIASGLLITWMAIWPAVGAAQDAASIPREVVARLTRDAADCRDIGGALSVGRDVALVTPADFNGDGRPDYLLNQHALRCSASASMFCGSAGCGHVVFLSRPEGGYVQAADIAASGAEIVSQGGRDVLRFLGDATQPLVWGWDGREFTLLDAARPTAPASSDLGNAAAVRAVLDIAYGQWRGDTWQDPQTDIYSPGLADLMEQTWFEDEVESGAFYDPLCPCNDWGMLRYMIDITHLDADTAIAEVPISFAPNSDWAETPALTHFVNLVRTSQGWRIDDIRTEEHGSTRDLLSQEIASRGR